jgi:hypothetical protein
LANRATISDTFEIREEFCDFESCSEINLQQVVFILMLCKTILIEPCFMSSEGTAVISVVVLQSHMDTPKGELGSCSETCVMSTHDGNDVVGIEVERNSDMREEEDQEPAIAVIKTEPEVSCVSVVSVMHISNRLYPELPAHISCTSREGRWK